jgi:bifunctional non-homologous end joining protein LigD
MSAVLDRLKPAISHRDLMRPTPAKPFSAAGWIFELKYDGFRCLALKHGDSGRLLSRNGNDMIDRFPEVAEALRGLPADVVLDGELVPAVGSPPEAARHPAP